MFFSQTSESVVFKLTFRKFDEHLSFLFKYIGIDLFDVLYVPFNRDFRNVHMLKQSCLKLKAEGGDF